MIGPLAKNPMIPNHTIPIIVIWAFRISNEQKPVDPMYSFEMNMVYVMRRFGYDL